MRRITLLSLLAIFAMVSGAIAQPAPVKPDLSEISFLVGTWKSGAGKVAETGQTSRGSSVMTLEAGGSVLLRRDHTELFNADGKPSGSFEQIMMIYPDGGAVHADYADGQHIIHYTSAAIVPGRSVAFTATASQTAPTFRLNYEMADPDTLKIRFEMAAPGTTAFDPIATGTLHRGNS